MMFAAIAILAALPVIAFRGRTLRLSLAVQAATYVLALILSLQIGGDRYFESVALFVVQFALFSLLLAIAPGREVRWSANRAAVIALLVYSLMVPAMLRTAIDGDEPFYLLMTESIVHDHDLDLTNQYRDLAHSATGRTDLRPQLGDPVGKHGEQYSRHEPFLPILLIPGYVVGKLAGAIATIVFFGVLLVRSTVRMFEDEGIDEATTRAVFPLFAFGPPIMFYTARIWPEVPAAFCFVEAVRGVRQRRTQRWIPALFGMTLLKLRFILVAIPLLLIAVRRRKHVAIAALAIGVPLVVVWLVSGSATSVHSWRELLPVSPRLYAIGFFGLLLDGAAGLLFQAPFYVLAIFAITRWRETPHAFRIGVVASLLYIVYLVPRAEWHGGWAPPLRYVVVFMPVLALGAAWMWRWIDGGVIALISIWTIGLVVHGIAFPYRLFHIENGENAVGEWLSRIYRSDFSRLFPSFIRFNDAAIVAIVVMIAFCVVAHFGVRLRAELIVAIGAVVVAAVFIEAQKPGRVVQFEDAHVMHDGGELYPPEYTVARFLYPGGWVLRANESLSFLSKGGTARLDYSAGSPASIEVGQKVYALSPGTRSINVAVPGGRVTLRCVSGAVNLDALSF